MSQNLQVKKLSVAIGNENDLTVIVDSLDFCILSGQTVALLGESGCGKSMTSLALMRLLPLKGVYSHESTVVLDKSNLLDLPEKKMQNLRGRRIAMIFQEPMTALNPVLTIGQQLVEAITGKSKARIGSYKERIIEILKEVEMPEPHIRITQFPYQLSGGQRQRVLIAMALARRPDILIADEPTTALDVTIQTQILTLLKKLQAKRKMGLLLITHDLTVVKYMASFVYVMYAGQLVEKSQASDFFATPLHPYSKQLLQSMPTLAKRSQKLITIPGSVPALDDLPQGCRFHPRCSYVIAGCDTSLIAMQKLKSKREVRCQLYPKIQLLPTTDKKAQSWPKKINNCDKILTINDLRVYFYPKKKRLLALRQPFKAVDGVSFTLTKGKTFALVGESGCGKSTLCKAILRLGDITAGEIVYNDECVNNFKRKKLRDYRKNVQIIFQDPFSSMNPRMTVGDIIAESMHVHGLTKTAMQKRQLELLDMVSLPKTSLDRYPHQFSGGQRQRICIARAIAITPRILICDEPTSALDISVQAQILNLLKDLQNDLQLTYLFVTHDMGVVSYIADEVMIMQNGKIVEMGDCETIFKSPQNSYTQELLSSVLEV